MCSLCFRLQKELDQSLKQAVETRWNTRLAMLQSVNDALRSGKLHDILLRRNELRYLNNIDSELLENLIHLLKPFDEATRHLSTDQTPTLHLVLPTKATLLRGLLIQDGDSKIVAEVIKNISYSYLLGGHSMSLVLFYRLWMWASCFSREIMYFIDTNVMLLITLIICRI